MTYATDKVGSSHEFHGDGVAAGDLFGQIFKGMCEAVVVVDGDGLITEYNPAAETFFGYPRPVVLGRKFGVLDRPIIRVGGLPLDPGEFPLEVARRTGGVVPAVLLGVMDSESVVHWVNVRAVPVGSPGAVGAPSVILYYENVSTLHAVSLRAALHAQVIGQSADAILILDSRGLVQDVNPAFNRLSGFDSASIVGGSLRLIEARQGDRTVFGQLNESIRRGEVWSNRIPHRRRDNSFVECLGTLSPLYGPGGSLTGFVYMLRDVSRIAEMERRMASSQKMEAIGTLAGGIAHDFNNLLHSISGYVELSIREVGEGRAIEYLQKVLFACERAEGLVRQILTFSRREDRNRRPVLLRDELEKAMDFVRITLPQGVVATLDLQCDEASVLGDPTEICQLVVNLLTNANQALVDGKGAISLSCGVIEITEANRGSNPNLTLGAYAQIVVTDTGRGIPEEIIRRIFDPFFTTKPVNEGTGMGLSIVHGVVTSMQGDITVESRVGEGTRFNILLPVIISEPTAYVAETPRPDRGNERVLMVDDEGSITAMVSEMLSGLGYVVTVCNSGESALAMVRANPGAFDVVITDQNMPRLTGVRLAGLIYGIRPSLPVLLCTGNAEKELVDDAQSSGVTHILHKPLRLAALAGIIRATLDRWESKAHSPRNDALMPNGNL